MKYRLLLLLSLLTVFSSAGQEIDKIVFSSQAFDEPPTVRGKPTRTVEYVKDELGNCTASHYHKNRKKIKLRTAIKIEKERLIKIGEWRTNNSSTFELADVGLDDDRIRRRAKDKDFETAFELPTNFLIRTDSFNLCQSWKMTRAYSTGGYLLRVNITYSTGEIDAFEFGSNDLGMGQFDLKGFIFSYHLLSENIPKEVYQYDFFTRDSFTDITLNYFKTIECEGYYYSEFTDKNPNRTARENRTMSGWDFVDYMKQRSKKE